MEQSLWTEKEVGEFLKISLTRLQQWRCRESGPPYIKLPTGAVRYQPQAVMDWAASGVTVPKMGTDKE